MKALRDTGRLDKADEAIVALSRIAADQLDAACADAEESRYTRGTLIARYAAVLSELNVRKGFTDDADGDLAALLAAMGDTPQP